MRFGVSHKTPICQGCFRLSYSDQHSMQQCFFSVFNRGHASAQSGNSFRGGNKKSQGNIFLVPGATAAALVMLGALHSLRMYRDKKLEAARERGIEVEFSPDIKATFLRILPLRFISRAWGDLSSIELPVWIRPYVYRAWARAFHSDLEEVGLPLESYASLRDFFARSLKEGCRPIHPDPQCLASPVDGIVVRFGEIKESGAMIEQVKGFCYSVFTLLGAKSLVPTRDEECMPNENNQKNTSNMQGRKSWWKISLASPEVHNKIQSCPIKGLYYCVIYLRPGDYHHVHSPTDWNVLVRRHFTGNLFPVNDRATRTIRNLYVENERVVLEGLWKEGFMAIAAIGATNVGSIELYIEPDLKTNIPMKKQIASEPPEELVYEPQGVGKILNKGDEMAAFNMGSTVVIVFQSSDFTFNIQRGDKVRVGQALGRINIL